MSEQPNQPEFFLRLPNGGYLVNNAPEVITKIAPPAEGEEPPEDFSQAFAIARDNPPNFLPSLTTWKERRMASIPIDSAVSLLRAHAFPPPADAPHDHGWLWNSLLVTGFGFRILNEEETKFQKRRLAAHEVVDWFASLPENIQRKCSVSTPPPIDDFPQQPTPQVGWYLHYANERIYRPDEQ